MMQNQKLILTMTIAKIIILGDDATPVGANQVVKIKLNKKTYYVKTNAKGIITSKIPKTLKPGTYILTAIYKGETNKNIVKVKQNLKTKKYTVKKSAKKLVIKATSKTAKKPLKTKRLHSNLTARNSPPKPINME